MFTASRLVEKYCDFLMQMPETELLLKEVCSSNQLILDEIPVMPTVPEFLNQINC